MARVGPNQDINDPTTIIDLAYQYQQSSDEFGDFLAQFIAQDPNVSGSPIVNVSIPFKMTDGSTQFILGSDIDFDDIYTYDTDLVSNATILTYVDLAERFRDYWESLNGVLDQLGDFDYLEETDIDPKGPTSVDLGAGITRTHGSLGGTEFTKQSYSHSPSGSLPTPSWSGIGPTDYNQMTYPQLLSALQSMDIGRTSSQVSWDTEYWYDKLTDAGGTIRSVLARFGKDESFSSVDSEQYVQIYNHESSPIEITLSISISATFDQAFSIGYSSWAEIDDVDVYPEPFGGLKHLLSSFESSSVTIPEPGGPTTISNTRIIEIPAGKSAFIGGTGAAATTLGAPGIGDVSITIILNDQTLTHSADVT